MTEYGLKTSTFNAKSQYSLQETFSKNVTVAKTQNNFSIKTLQRLNIREVHNVIYIMKVYTSRMHLPNTPDSSQRHTVHHNKPGNPPSIFHLYNAQFLSARSN